MDITTLAAAKAYTDKKVGNGGAAPLVIDLREFNLESYNSGYRTSFNEVVSGLFVNGGGERSEIDANGFWDYIPSDRPFTLLIDATELAGCTIECSPTCVIKPIGGRVGNITISFVTYVGDNLIRASVILSDLGNVGGYGNHTSISVIVEPLQIP